MMKWYGEFFKAGVLYSRAGVATQIILSAANHLFLVDTGDGTLRDLLKQKIDIEQIRAIFLSHGHHDHISGLYAILAHFRNMERNEKITIVYPKGVPAIPRIIQAFLNSFSDISYSIDEKQIGSGDRLTLFNVSVQVFQMTHYAAVGVHKLLHPDIAVGYRFSFKGESIAISGDTGLCPQLEKLVKGADIAFIDSTLKTNEVTEERLAKLHLSEEKARDLGKLAGQYIPIHRSLS